MSNRIVVVTPFYNPGEFLEKCVASLMSQKYDNFKVIFVDDCSTDGSFDKLPKYIITGEDLIISIGLAALIRSSRGKFRKSTVFEGAKLLLMSSVTTIILL